MSFGRLREEERALAHCSPRLRLQITALALPVVLPILAFGSAVVLYWYGERQAATERAPYQKSSEITEAVDRLIGEQIRVLRALVLSPALDRPDLAAFHESAARIRTENPEWANLILIDSQTGQRAPEGRPVRIELRTEDVIHSFWVPALTSKTDLIPGQTNVTWIEASAPACIAVNGGSIAASSMRTWRSSSSPIHRTSSKRGASIKPARRGLRGSKSPILAVAPRIA